MWVSIKAAYSQPEDVPSFNHGHMISYFVSRTAAYGLPSSDIKSIYKATKHLYDCGHIQNFEVGSNSNALYIQATCIPEMQKDHIYKLIISLDLKTFDVTAAVCGHPAAKGPSASCKHIGALCYALVEFAPQESYLIFWLVPKNFRLGTSLNQKSRAYTSGRI